MQPNLLSTFFFRLKLSVNYEQVIAKENCANKCAQSYKVNYTEQIGYAPTLIFRKVTS